MGSIWVQYRHTLVAPVVVPRRKMRRRGAAIQEPKDMKPVASLPFKHSTTMHWPKT